MPSTNRKKGDDFEKYCKEWMEKKQESQRYQCEIHPRTMRPLIGEDGKPVFKNGRPLYISQDNDNYNAFDINCDGDLDGTYIQSKYMEDPKNFSKILSGVKNHIDENYPVKNPGKMVFIFAGWKEWVAQTPEKRRHKEYFHRALKREIVDGKFVWVERSAWSNLPNQKRLTGFGVGKLKQSS